MAFALLFVFFAIVGTLIWVTLAKKHDDWERLPTREEYLAKNPGCSTPRGIRCAVCKGGSIKNWGLLDSESKKRSFICNGCGTALYRNEG